MFKTSEEVEAFRSLLSEKTGTYFSHRIPNPRFLVNIHAIPGRVVGDDELFHCLEESLNALAIFIDRESLRAESSGLVWVKMKKGEKVFSLGVMNSINPRFIIVTVTPL